MYLAKSAQVKFMNVDSKKDELPVFMTGFQLFELIVETSINRGVFE